MSHRLDPSFEQALAYIDKHLHTPIDTAALANIAGIAEQHFSHLFYALYGLSLDAYVDLLKSLQAAHQLGFGEQIPLSAIASSLGYDDEAHFIVSFTQSIGQSPQSFRQKPDWGNFFAKQQPLKSFQPPKENEHGYRVDAVELDSLTLATMRHSGTADTLPTTINRFMQWRKQHSLGPNVGRIFNLIYSHPKAQPYFIDIGVSLSSEAIARLSTADLTGASITTKVVPAGRYATLSVSTDATYRDINTLLHSAVGYLYRDWLDSNNVKLGNFPLMFERLNIAKRDNAEQQVCIYLALQ
ncbi:AraC family transcriptional regulator [Shewanella sp. A14]